MVDPSAVVAWLSEQGLDLEDWQREQLDDLLRLRPLSESVRQSFGMMPWIRSADVAAQELAFTYAARIDEAVDGGDAEQITKALYLGPHLLNALKELGGTPAARKTMQSSSPVGGALASIRANLPAGSGGGAGQDHSEAVD